MIHRLISHSIDYVIENRPNHLIIILQKAFLCIIFNPMWVIV